MATVSAAHVGGAQPVAGGDADAAEHAFRRDRARVAGGGAMALHAQRIAGVLRACMMSATETPTSLGVQ